MDAADIVGGAGQWATTPLATTPPPKAFLTAADMLTLKVAR